MKNAVLNKSLFLCGLIFGPLSCGWFLSTNTSEQELPDGLNIHRGDEKCASLSG